MTFKTDRVVNRLALPVTRRCNRSCPECPARARGMNTDNETTLDELRWVGKTIGPIAHVEVTGGEPSLHPDFAEISAHIHEWFDCQDFLLLTNGYLFEDDAALPLLLHWDRVYITWYTNDFAVRHRSSANTAVVNRVEDYLKSKGRPVWVQRMDAHVPLSAPPAGANGCRFGYDRNDMVAYHKGQLYGCCTAWQLENRGRGIVLTEDWRTKLGGIDLPCDKCFLGAVC